MSGVLEDVTNLQENSRIRANSVGSNSAPTAKRICAEGIDNSPSKARDSMKCNAELGVDKDACDSCSSFNDLEISLSRDTVTVAVVVTENNGDPADVCGDSCESTGPVTVAYENCDIGEGVCAPSITNAAIVGEASTGNMINTFEFNHRVGRTDVPTSFGFKSFGLNRCTVAPEDENAPSEALKSCSCSFCVKAAYILSDLYYQDLRGKIAALKKSQKEAIILTNKYAKEMSLGDGSTGKLESNLTDQWKFLFSRMQDIFSQEILQQQSKFNEAKELREECKAEMEKLRGISFNKF